MYFGISTGEPDRTVKIKLVPCHSMFIQPQETSLTAFVKRISYRTLLQELDHVFMTIKNQYEMPKHTSNTCIPIGPKLVVSNYKIWYRTV